MVEHQASDEGIAGSNPGVGIHLNLLIIQMIFKQSFFD
jgi:hypothetical protein